MNKAASTRVIIRKDSIPTTLRIVGDVSSVLHASCFWESNNSSGSKIGKISAIRLPNERIRFGLGASAFGPYPTQAIQQLGECALIDGIPWWTTAEKPRVSRCEAEKSEMLTPFLVAWNTLDSAWAFLDSSTGFPLVKWYEQLFQHPVIRKTGVIAIQVIAQIPAGKIVDKYMSRAPLASTNKLHNNQTIVDPDLIDKYFVRNTIRNEVPPDTICTLVMVGIVIDPKAIAAAWGDDVLRRGFYNTPGITVEADVIQHTHAAVMLDSYPIPDHILGSSQSINDDIALITKEMASRTHQVSLVHIESDTFLSKAIARIGIIENVEAVF
ncbi:MAG TPA: hypothetical protein VJ761_05450 [Ktedonobacteraceae bacterium]|nr:hypothetical protein [Ktedonobacteraceae bacterium]